MIKEKVKVFDFNAVLNDDMEEDYEETYNISYFDLMDINNKPLYKDGYIYYKDRRDNHYRIKPLKENHVTEKYKYIFEDKEKETVRKYKLKIKKLNEELRQTIKAKQNYELNLLEQCSELPIFYGDEWECHLSPTGSCIYNNEYDEPTCIFCGEPEERK